MEDRELPRREREKLTQRQEMLAAALALFSEKGYHNVSMQEVAQKAEFAVGTLYKFFRSKEDLYKALLVEMAGTFDNALRIAIEKPDPEIGKLRNYVKVKGELFRSNASMIRLYFSETQGASCNINAGFDSEVRERHGKFLKKLATVFESGMERKQFRRIADPYSLAVALASITNAFLLLWLEDPARHPYPEDPDTILNILFKGLVDP
ncbi:MAG: TetR family transcriptional regulator [Deltaproteobacteria bacterium CG2_30_66_27]|nr:MAG: TetR family transcriptional regulator [Deltaproteobacteria bacterium CG2_30_66_27]PJB32861.1 MAG: TetR/AcrR family transcriptional regulator [Deltaproteobacteria bacterium CG_4_9_14_3_um_filter_65_9]